MPDRQEETAKNYLEKREKEAHARGLSLANKLIKGRMTADRFAKIFTQHLKAGIYESKTGLFTPSFFQAEFDLEVSEARRYQHDLSLMVIDVDKLKHFNDTFGHQVGDHVILTVARAIKKVIRLEDVPSRWGGDEFVVLLPETEVEGAKILAKRIHEELKQNHVKYKENLIKVKVSIGISQLKKRESSKTLFSRADTAAYESKLKGRNSTTVL